MTLMDRGISTVRPATVGQSFEVRWSSLRHEEATARRVARVEFVLRLEIINRDHAVVEAWVESPGGRRQILERQPMRITLEVDERSMQVDVFDEHSSPPHPGARIAALSIPRGTASNGSNGSPLYAQTTLLRKAGFAAGTHDRPRLLQHAANAADAATA